MPLEYISGGRVVDDRGSLLFINDLDLSLYRRFYMVENHAQGFVRAWHGHQREGKAVVVLQGAAIVAAVAVDDWSAPSRDLPVERRVLSATNPGALVIPPGYANGFKTLTPDTRVCFFSTSSLEESAGDDIRFDADYWNPWIIEER